VPELGVRRGPHEEANGRDDQPEAKLPAEQQRLAEDRLLLCLEVGTEQTLLSAPAHAAHAGHEQEAHGSQHAAASAGTPGKLEAQEGAP